MTKRVLSVLMFLAVALSALAGTNLTVTTYVATSTSGSDTVVPTARDAYEGFGSRSLVSGLASDSSTPATWTHTDTTWTSAGGETVYAHRISETSVGVASAVTGVLHWFWDTTNLRLGMTYKDATGTAYNWNIDSTASTAAALAAHEADNSNVHGCTVVASETALTDHMVDSSTHNCSTIASTGANAFVGNQSITSGELRVATTTDMGAYEAQINGTVYVSDTGATEHVYIGVPADNSYSSIVMAASDSGSVSEFALRRNGTGYGGNLGGLSLELGVPSSRIFGIVQGSTPRFVVDDGGDVLVATTTDAGDFTLQVMNNCLLFDTDGETVQFIDNASSTGYGQLRFVSDSDEVAYICKNGSAYTADAGQDALVIYNNTAKKIAFYQGANLRAMLDTSGRFLVATSTSIAATDIFSVAGNGTFVSSSTVGTSLNLWNTNGLGNTVLSFVDNTGGGECSIAKYGDTAPSYAGELHISNGAASPIKFWQSTENPMSINASGVLVLASPTAGVPVAVAGGIYFNDTDDKFYACASTTLGWEEIDLTP